LEKKLQVAVDARQSSSAAVTELEAEALQLKSQSLDDLSKIEGEHAKAGEKLLIQVEKVSTVRQYFLQTSGGICTDITICRHSWRLNSSPRKPSSRIQLPN